MQWLQTAAVFGAIMHDMPFLKCGMRVLDHALAWHAPRLASATMLPAAGSYQVAGGAKPLMHHVQCQLLQTALANSSMRQHPTERAAKFVPDKSTAPGGFSSRGRLGERTSYVRKFCRHMCRARACKTDCMHVSCHL